MWIDELVKDVCSYLKTFPQVKDCCLYDSISKNDYDNYSDIDIEIDVFRSEWLAISY